MMHKRTVYSLLLTSFILVFAFSSALAQSVTFESKGANRCEAGLLNITVDPGNPDLNAIEIVFEISSASGGAFHDGLNVVWDPLFSDLTNRVIDMSGVDGVSPDTVRLAALATDSGATCLSGVTVVAQVEFVTNDVCSGEIALDGAVYTSPTNPLIVAPTQFVDCATNALIAATVVAGTITVTNETPSIDPISDATVSWTSCYAGLATGDDPDLANGCEALTFSKLDGPAGLTINPATGAMSWCPTGDDICVDTVVIQIEDACGATASTSFTICVTNEAPEFASCSTPDRTCWGAEVSGTVDASDPDGGPSVLSYSLASFNGPGNVTVSPSTGAWSWQVAEQNEYIGTFTLCIEVTDGANICDPCSPSNADTCCVEIEVIPTFRVSIEKTHETPFGGFEDVSISLDNGIDPGNPMGGFDLLIQYDASVLSFNSATMGALIDVDGDGWEYFEFRHGQAGNCGSNACPSGKLRILAIAETNNGANHPAGFGETPAASSELASLRFLVTNDYTHECQYVPIVFCWYDCGDNAISSKSGDTLFISRNVYNFDLGGNVTGDYPFPTLYGANSTCDTLLDDGKPDPERCIDFYNGGIDIVCVDSIDDRGDINLNAIPNEVADAVLFSNYFVYGLDVFTINTAGQVAATDVNADGTVLSVADLVYLIRIVVGDAQPYAKITPLAVQYTHDSKSGVMTVKDNVEIGAAHLVISGKVEPILLADEMEIQYAYDGTNTRVLVWSQVGNSFTGAFLNVTSEVDVISLEMATYEGQPVSLEVLPTQYGLNQNYPNPFNPSTVISFSLPTQSDYTITIFNVNGQQVAVLSGSEAAGEHEIVWEAGSVNASGVYFYRLVAENGTDRYVDTKKMVLLK